jgi:hypothetical protein
MEFPEKLLFWEKENRILVLWNELRKAINEELLKYKVNEDKLMGPYFISKKNLPEGKIIDPEEFSRIFKNKVIMYLFDDAAKQKRTTLFEGCEEKSRNQYSKICNEFDEKERKGGKIKAGITLGVTGVLIAALVIAVGAVKPMLGDIGNVVDMLGYTTLSYVNPIKGRAKANKLLEKTDGFMKGVCHVKNLNQAEVATEANMEWNREDIGGSYTYNATTKEVTPSQGFINRFTEWKEIYEKTGMKYFCVTPYPEDYSYMQIVNPLVNEGANQQVILRGLPQEECTDEKHVEINEEALGAVAKFFMKEMLGVVYAYQISNELMGSRFRYNNMTMDEAAYFIGVQLKAMVEAREELVKNGVEIDIEPNKGQSETWQMWIHDPDGNKFEIMQYTPLSLQHKGNIEQDKEKYGE